MAFTVLSAATAVLAALTLLPLWRNPHWLIRGMDFPRLQFAVLALVLLLMQGALLDLEEPLAWALIAITAGCLFWQLWWILPYTRIWRNEVPGSHEAADAKRVRLLTSNVLMSNRNAADLLSLVKLHAPDILVTLESNQWWQDQLDSLLSDYPHSVKCPLDNRYGMHVYSRLPLEEAQIAYLVEDDKPSIHALTILRSGDSVRMHFVHPAPPSPTEHEDSEERDAELVMVARSVASSRRAIIVTGDLNDVAWSSTTRLFRKISGLLDPRVGRGMFNTFHADYLFLRWPLDHVFHSRHFRLASMQRLPSIGSDHFPLLTELVYAPAHDDEKQGLDADADDRSRARSIMNEQRVHASAVPRPGE